MNLSERPPILTVHEDAGDYILRLGDARFRSLVVGVSKLLPGARRLIIVTPTDVKFFTGDGTHVDSGAEGGAGDLVAQEAEADAEVTADEEAHPLPHQPLPEEPPPETAPPKAVGRRKPLRSTEKAGTLEACQRCAGTGTIRTLMPDNTAAESACPICQGEGTMKRFGRPR